MAGETGSSPADVAALNLIKELRSTLAQRETLIAELVELLEKKDQKLIELLEKNDLPPQIPA